MKQATKQRLSKLVDSGTNFLSKFDSKFKMTPKTSKVLSIRVAEERKDEFEIQQKEWKWTFKCVDLLCYGFLRQHLHVAIDDIASIVITHVGIELKLIEETIGIKSPCCAHGTPFVLQSIDTFNTNRESMFLLGGYKDNETEFVQLNCQLQNALKSSNKDFAKYVHFSQFCLLNINNANLKNINKKNARHMISFMITHENVKNNEKSKKYILVLIPSLKNFEYNVFCVSDDKWLFDKNEELMLSKQFTSYGAKALLFSENLLIITEGKGNNMYFCDVSNLNKIRLIGVYVLS